MRFSFSIIFLGWWLTRQRCMARGQNSPMPSISVSPSSVVALGGSVIINCKSESHQPMELHQYKEGSGSWQILSKKVAEKGEVTFPIANAQHSDEGHYLCEFKDSSQQQSHYSSQVRIKIREQVYPMPSISVSPKEVVALGESATIHCKSEGYSWASRKFSLIKEGAPDITEMEIAEGKEEAVFCIPSTGQSDAGIYWCDYKLNSDPRYSFFSERVYINVTDLGFSKPSIKIRPKGQHALGVNITVLCQGPENGLTFFLRKSMDLRASQKTEPESNMTKFHVLKIRLEDAGSYTCQYHKRGNPFVWSVSSEPAELVVKDARLSKPSIRMKSTQQTSSGFNVTIECQGPEMGLIFFLFKSMDPIATQAETERNASAFQVFMLAEAGHYTCQYHRKGDPFVWSEPSDPLGLDKGDRSTIIMWASIAAGFLLLLFLLLLLIFKFCRKRRKGSTSKEPKQPVTMPLETVAEADPSDVSYAVLNPQSLKIKRAADPEIVSEPCVYASVANNRTRKSS